MSIWASPLWAATGFDRMAEQIEAQFPDIQGIVLSVENGEVLIDLKKGQPIHSGDRLKVIRYGEQIVHPVTGEVIGRKETDIGVIEVTEVRTNYSVARPLNTNEPIQNGDGVESRFRKMVILSAPVLQAEDLSLDTQAVGLAIERSLKKRPRMEVPAFGMQAWMLDQGLQAADLMKPQVLARLNKEIAFDLLLLSRVETVQGQTVLRYRVVAVEDGAVLQEARVVFDEMTALATPESGTQSQAAKELGMVKFIGKQDFDFVLADMDVGDLDGDGEPEFVFIDRNQVMIYRFIKGQYVKIGTIRVPAEFNRFLTVDVADINGNGRAEIFVTNQVGQKLESFILEQAPGQTRFEKIAIGLNRYFRVIRSYKGVPRLLTQRPGVEEPFGSEVRTMVYKNNTYKEGAELGFERFLNQQTTLYGVTLEDTNFDKSIEIIVLDNNYNLRVYSTDGKLLVKSEDYYGHDPRQIEVGLKDQPYVDFTDPYVPRPVRYKGRLVPVQKRNQRFLLVPKNHRFGGNWLSELVVINSSSLAFIAVNKEGLETAFETNKQKGYLAAFQVVGTKDSRRHQVHVATVADKGGLFRDEKMTTLFVYDWK
ncbi:FG-GAP repeat domain-containing protein [Nitrospina sp. 32_T5]|uniref:FG-GAP repeat domain-containing protein n=1 Tax=unclassified Nitrospina TaxID=2638683 RepID=UPI003F95F75A